MKKIFSAIVLMLAAATASAQLYVGGSFNLSRETSENVTDFTIAPELGYKFNDTWAVGAGLGFTHNYDNGLKTNVFTIAPYARYTYFRSDNNLVNLFVDGGVEFGFGKSKQGDYSSETVIPFEIGFKPGIMINVTEKFGVLAKLGFLGYRGGNDAAKDAGFNEAFGISFKTVDLDFGFVYTF